MNKLVFGKSWFPAKKRITEVWDETKAQTAHERRKLYVAVLFRDERPHCFLEFTNGSVGVGFLDDFQREYLSYNFHDVEPERLFLSRATHREFEGDSDKVSSGTTYYFKRDGRVIVEHADISAATVSTKETHIDVTGNWEPYPQFGQYDSIARVER